MLAPLHPLENERLEELHRYGILDTEREREFDELVEIVSDICEAPVAVLNFIDEGRQWFKAEVGLGIRSTPLDTSLCGHVILQHDFVEIPDTLKDRRMADNALCTAEPGFRFYAGYVLKGSNGLPLGTLCVLDYKPRSLSERQRNLLRIISKHVMRELDLRIALEQEQALRREVDHRVKNSLASIGALISMKARRESNDAVRLALEDASSRICSVSALHAELHNLVRGQLVDLQSLLGRIESDLRQLIPDSVKLLINVQTERTTPAFANAVLLIVNEFVSNSVKHGQNGDGGGVIQIDIRSSNREWQIVCKDDGKATALDAKRATLGSGLGTRVIQSCASSLGAVVEWRSNGSGMELIITSQGE